MLQYEKAYRKYIAENIKPAIAGVDINYTTNIRSLSESSTVPDVNYHAPCGRGG